MALTKVTYSMIQGACVNVLDYGAVADGVTNDAAAITAAVATGKNVYLPRGTYYYNTNTPTQLNSNQTIFGDGSGQTIIKTGTDSAGSYGALYAASKNFVGVHSMTLDGNSTVSGVAVGGNRSLLRFSACNDVSLYDIEIKNYGQKEGGTIPPASGPGGEGPEIYAWAVGFGGCTRVSFEDIYLHDCYVEGWAVYNCRIVECNNFRGYKGTGNCSTPLHIAAFGNVDLSKYINVSNVFIDGSEGSAFNLTGEYININNINIINQGSVGIDSSEEGLTVGQYNRNLNYTNISITGDVALAESYFGLVCTGNNVNLTNINVKYCEQNIILGSTGLPTENYSLTNCSSTESLNKTSAAQDYNIVFTAISNVAIDGCVFKTTQAGSNAIIQNCSNLRITKSTFANGAGGNIVQKATQFGWIQNCVFDQSAIAAYSGVQISSADAGGDPVGTTANIWLESNYFVGSTNVYAVSLDKGQNVFTHNNINANVNAGKNLVYMDTFDISDVVTDNAATLTFRNPLDFRNGFVWVSSTNKLYINATRPANDTDGTVVGTQT
jgi:hypothetical protein